MLLKKKPRQEAFSRVRAVGTRSIPTPTLWKPWADQGGTNGGAQVSPQPWSLRVGMLQTHIFLPPRDLRTEVRKEHSRKRNHEKTELDIVLHKREYVLGDLIVQISFGGSKKEAKIMLPRSGPKMLPPQHTTSNLFSIVGILSAKSKISA
jgi:hypothetical protein